MNSTEREHAPGMVAIATTLADLYGVQARPMFWPAQEPASRGGQDILEGVSAYATEDHWHYISYGLSDLYDDDRRFPSQPEASGYGFELTLRLARVSGTRPPAWPVALFHRLARYVARSSNVFSAGDHMVLGTPLDGRTGTTLEALLFTHDPQLPTLDTRLGQVRFVQLVGVTAEELDAAKNWRCDAVLELMARHHPLLVTDLNRPSWLRDPRFAQACREGARQEGSSHGSSFAPLVRWSEDGRGGLDLGIAAIAVTDVLRALRLRIPFNKPFRLHGRRGAVGLVPGLAGGWQSRERELVVQVPWDAAAGMAQTLRGRRGVYAWPGIPGLRVEVIPTDIRGSRGELVRVIG